MMTRKRAGTAACLVALLTAMGCEGKRPAQKAPAKEATPAREATPEEDAPAAAPTPAPDATALGKVLPSAPLPIESMLGKPPAEVEGFLGEPVSKGMVRSSCVRHVPDRTWFECNYVAQKYADKAGKFDRIGIEYEDGIAASMSWEPLPGEGPFDPKKALKVVGLELPGEPRVHHPAENVVLWSYFNSAARLRIAGREYRVEVSVVDNAWTNAKVELILNERLTEDQKKRILPVKPRGSGDAKDDAPAPG